MKGRRRHREGRASLHQTQQAERASSRALAPLLCCLGIAAYRFLPWITSRGPSSVGSAIPPELPTIFQLLAVCAFVALDLRQGGFFRRHHRGILLAGALSAAVGSALVTPGGAAPVDQTVLAAIGLALRGCGSAALLVGCGVALSAFSVRTMCLVVASGFSLYGLLAVVGSAIPQEALEGISPALPLLSGLCLVLSLREAPAQPTDSAARCAVDSAMRRFPWDVAGLLALCALSTVAVKALLKSQNFIDTFASSIFWMGSYVFVLLIYLYWVKVRKRDDPDNLWPVLVIIVIAGFLFYSTIHPTSASFANGFLNAIQKTLLLFAWVFAMAFVIREGCLCVPVFGLANVVFLQLPTLLNALLRHVAPSANTALGATEASVIAAVMVFLLVCASFLLFARKAFRQTGAPRAVGDEATHTDLPSADSEMQLVINALARRYALTPREQEVVAHLARGYTFPQIAEKLFVTLDTVQSHAKSIYRKMGIHKKQELVEAIEQYRSGSK